jgi:hypothetical protein
LGRIFEHRHLGALVYSLQRFHSTDAGLRYFSWNTVYGLVLVDSLSWKRGMSLMWELVDGAFIDVAEVAAAGFINPDAIEWKSLSDHLWCGGAIGAEIGCGDAVHGGAGKGLVVQRVAVGGEGDRIGSELRGLAVFENRLTVDADGDAFFFHDGLIAIERTVGFAGVGIDDD